MSSHDGNKCTDYKIKQSVSTKFRDIDGLQEMVGDELNVYEMSP